MVGSDLPKTPRFVHTQTLSPGTNPRPKNSSPLKTPYFTLHKKPSVSGKMYHLGEKILHTTIFDGFLLILIATENTPSPRTTFFQVCLGEILSSSLPC